MKSNIIKNITVACCLITTALLFTTCKKYPEDKFYSWRTAKQRLEGEWKITSVLINGDDAAYKYNDSLPIPITEYYLWIKSKTLLVIESNRNLFLINKSSKSFTEAKDADVFGTKLSFESEKKQISVSNRTEKPIKDSISCLVFKNMFKNYWDIKKLHRKEMILEKTVNNNNYRLTLKNIRKDE